MGPLPKTSQGHQHILLVTDLFSKWIEAFPLATTVNEVICCYGVPATLRSDKAPNLWSQTISSLCDMLGIDKIRTSAYHPQGNAQVEWFNHTLEAMLSKWFKATNRTGTTISQKSPLPTAQPFMKSLNSVYTSWQFGHSPKLPTDRCYAWPHRWGRGRREGTWVRHQSEAHIKWSLWCCPKQHSKSHKRNKAAYDKKISGHFQVGDRVWLHVPALKTSNTKKLASLWRDLTQLLTRLVQWTIDFS